MENSLRTVFFVHRDEGADERQSDGVHLCVIPSREDGKVCFYCNEYMLIWDSLEDVGELEDAIPIDGETKIRPATLVEVCEAGLADLVDLVVQHERGEDGQIHATFMQLP
ncbi:hypothetical protein FRX94_04700 [Corynebacterium canis]|uniref:Uncharacterized protein n=1 Tax=Corynebacterium canis TaxID=679663 RepID=A0A5C5ULJ3_9CORY|nr:hypothetical protein [Corynebacterium canis]TWT26697.1 hypothetical protein FRX94_04700 [Corynebacterium canis]WJY74624.1 hypothetical protein CCANI_03860 [Corynebacterium canis]